MSTAVMTERIAETSPRFEASGLAVAGVIYLLSVLGAAFAEILRWRQVECRRKASWWSLAMTAVTLLFYGILSPLNRRLSFACGVFQSRGTTLLRFFGCSLGARTSRLCLTGSFCILIGCLVFRSSFLPESWARS